MVKKASRQLSGHGVAQVARYPGSHRLIGRFHPGPDRAGQPNPGPSVPSKQPPVVRVAFADKERPCVVPGARAAPREVDSQVSLC